MNRDETSDEEVHRSWQLMSSLGRDKIDLASFFDKIGISIQDVQLERLTIQTEIEPQVYDNVPPDVRVWLEYRKS